MNEEIRKNAKFYLLKYSERIADDLKMAINNLEQDRKTRLQRSGIGVIKMTPDWYDSILTTRIIERENRIESYKNSLKEIDEILNVI